MDVSDQSDGLYRRAVILEFNQHNMHQAFELSERARAFLDQISVARSQSSARLPTEFSARDEKLWKENILLERQIGQKLSKPSPEINTERLQTLQARLAAVHQAYEDAVRDLKISNLDLASLITAPRLPLPELKSNWGQMSLWWPTSLPRTTTPEFTLKKKDAQWQICGMQRQGRHCCLPQFTCRRLRHRAYRSSCGH